MVAWVEVLVQMVDAPSVPIQGTIRRTGPVEPYMSYGGDIPPVFVNGVDDLQVWRDGTCVRVDTIDGTPLARTDGEHSWRWAFGHEYPLMGSMDELSYHGPGSELLTSRPAGKWVGNKYAQLVNPVEEIEHLGRRCWSFALTPPSDQPHSMQMIVDQSTGVVLEQRMDGYGHSVSFIEFTAGVGTGPIEGRLARRPRSSLPWEEPWQEEAQTWSTLAHDWAIDLFGLVLDDAALADLQHRLHPGFDVIGVPEIDS